MAINRAKLRELVFAEFGPDLRRISPAGAREFLNRLYRAMHQAANPPGQRIEISEPARDYDQVMAEFFVSTLDMPCEKAALLLWLHAFEQHFLVMQDEYTERFLEIFEGPESISEGDDEQK